MANLPHQYVDRRTGRVCTERLFADRRLLRRRTDEGKIRAKAVQYGVPCITTRITGIPELIRHDIDGLLVNGDPRGGFPGILNVSVDDIEGESLLLALEPLCVATGSACNSKSQEPSSVLRALGRSDMLAQSAIRFSFGRPTTAAEVDFAVTRYREAVGRLRDVAAGLAA